MLYISFTHRNDFWVYILEWRSNPFVIDQNTGLITDQFFSWGLKSFNSFWFVYFLFFFRYIIERIFYFWNVYIIDTPLIALYHHSFWNFVYIYLFWIYFIIIYIFMLTLFISFMTIYYPIVFNKNKFCFFLL